MNLLGQREPERYGQVTLAELTEQLQKSASTLGGELEAFQSNSESELIEKIQANNGEHFIIFNPAAFTHTSVALRDALIATRSHFIEVHITNPHSREDFRQKSFFSDIAVAVIAGCGLGGYLFALQTAFNILNQLNKE